MIFKYFNDFDMNRFQKNGQEPVFDIAANFLPISGQKVEYFVTDYALATDECLDTYFPRLFKGGKPRKRMKLYVAEED